MARAGYNIKRAPEVWTDFDRVSSLGDGPIRLMFTHPGCVSRRRALQGEVSRMEALGWRPGHVPTATLHVLSPSPGHFCI